MELGSILHFLQGKSILITGVTGFLAKVLLEKILRVQPNVKKVYLLLRAADSKSATHRLHNEIIEKDLFRLLKEKHGANFNSFISEKLTAVPGDISCENLGLKDSTLREEIYNETHVIINSAATVNFVDRYDISLGINTFGVKHIIDFAKKCTKFKVLVHVSTAYVCGEGEGLILEKAYHLGDSLNGVAGLDIVVEEKLVRDKLDELSQQGATEKEIRKVMKDLGITRAKKYGWTNTYTFTKAMGEMLVEELRGNLSIVIVRPSIVTATFKEPFPGWVEGVRTIDSFGTAYGKGKLTHCLGDRNTFLDAIPADMVVNAMLVAMVAHAKDPSDTIYHLVSSVTNQLRYGDVHDFFETYFRAKPLINNGGKPIRVHKVVLFTNMDSFHRYVFIRYLLPLKGLELANTAFCEYFKETCLSLNNKIQTMMRLAEIYRPYLLFKGGFDDKNTEKLRIAARQGGVETDLFYFDPNVIIWDHYFLNIHLPGFANYNNFN